MVNLITSIQPLVPPTGLQSEWSDMSSVRVEWHVFSQSGVACLQSEWSDMSSVRVE
jgi:hypothetical protein